LNSLIESHPKPQTKKTGDHCPSVEAQFVDCKVKSRQAFFMQSTSFAVKTSMLTSGSLKSSFVAINPAGKGSSLEAIAQVPFPPGSEALCLPRSLSCAALHSMQSTQASFHPGRGLQSREKATLKFQYRPAKNLDRDEFSGLFALASDRFEALD
jgi:hypothetical protein